MTGEREVEQFVVRVPHISRPNANWADSCMSSIMITIPKNLSWQEAHDLVVSRVVTEFCRYGVHEVLASAGIKK